MFTLHEFFRDYPFTPKDLNIVLFYNAKIKILVIRVYTRVFYSIFFRRIDGESRRQQIGVYGDGFADMLNNSLSNISIMTAKTTH